MNFEIVICIFQTDADLVFESDDRFLPYAASGFNERSVPVAPWTPQTLHHSLIHRHRSRSVNRPPTLLSLQRLTSI